jgi:hypothetical protein
MNSNSNADQDQPLVTGFLSPLTIRIIALQLLFFGLLFLPEFSIYPLKWEVAELSIIMKTFQEIVDNPAFYGLLMVVTVILMFSFEVSVDEDLVHEGKVSAGVLLLRALGKVFSIYAGLFFISWFFLIYKLRFMGEIYINSQILAG